MFNSFCEYIDLLKALAEPTRLRLVRLCAQGELTVSELVRIIGQSQPRVSRHLKLLQDARVLESFREQHWVLYRASTNLSIQQLITELLAQLPDDDSLQLDQVRLDELRNARSKLSEEFVETEVPDWLRLHEYHGDERTFKNAVQHSLSDRPVGHVLDIATGTGRMLKIAGPLASSGVGIDLSKKMVMVARNALVDANLPHLTVRQEDMYQMRFPARHFDTVIIDQVLYFASNPDALIKEASRVLKTTGRLLIVAFTPTKTVDKSPTVSLAIGDILSWIKDASLEVKATTVLPGDVLDISLLVSEKAAD